MRRPLLVGQALPKRAVPSPLYPIPNSAGSRLAKFMGIDHETYLATFDRVNVLDFFPGQSQGGEDLFLAAQARMAAKKLEEDGHLENRQVIFLGKNTCGVFGHRANFFEWVGSRVVVPHPSGRNRFWNTEDNRVLGGEFLRELLNMET